MSFASANDLTRDIDDPAIQNILNDFAAAWNAHDARSFSQLFAEDADFTNVKGVSRHGRAAFEEFHEPLFKTIWAYSKITITKNKVRFIKQDVAAVDAWWDLTGLKKSDGSDAPPRTGLLILIMTKSDNKWEITVMHNMDLRGSVSQKY